LDVRVQVQVRSRESNRIFADKALQPRVVVPRPTVTPTESLPEKSRAAPMRVWATPTSSSGARGRARSRRSRWRR